MDRLAARLGLAALVLSACGSAGAQTMQTLRVRNFELAADRASVRVGETFHLTLTAHVDQLVLELDNVTLPDLAGFNVLGDERRCAATQHGSDCTETLTVEATEPGDRTIAPVVMDAIDARNHKPSRFLTNSVTLRVIGPTAFESGPPAGLVNFLLSALWDLLIVGLAALGGWALVWGWRRRSHATPPVLAAVPAPVEPPPLEPNARLHLLVEALVREPTRARALAVREAVRATFSPGDDETLTDLIARGAIGSGPYTLGALAALERAAFCEDASVAEAIREALPFLKT